MAKLDEIDLEGMKEFFKNREIRFPNAAEDALKKLNLSYLPDIDDAEKTTINERKRYAKEAMDDWRFWYSLWYTTLKLMDETKDQKAFEEYEKIIDNEIYPEMETALKEAKDANLEADTIEKYGLNAHSSILKDSLFFVVPLVAYILLKRVR
jgi:hypothetical protein